MEKEKEVEKVKEEVKKVKEEVKKGVKKEKLFQNKKYLYTIVGGIVAFLLIMIIIISLNATNKIDRNDNNDSGNGKNFSVKIHIDFTKNIIFSKYDVIISVGNQRKRLYHGENADVEFHLGTGSYTINFVNAEDTSIKNEKNINVNDNDIDIGYKISCYNNRIEVKDLYFDENIALNENEIKMTTDKSSLIRKNYKDVINELEKMGFSNIIEKPLYDIDTSDIDTFLITEGEVESVTIDSKDDYSRGTVFQKDAEVIVSYHLKSQDDPEKVSIPYGWLSGKDINYEKVEQAFRDAGFNHIVTHTKSSARKINENKVYDIKIGGESAEVDKKYKTDEEVAIYYYTYKPRVSETELDTYYVHKAFEEYGEQKYKYGFKSHWITGIKEERENTDGSFYIKVEVTITNEYGADYDTVAEGMVSGSNANPKVTNFSVK